MPKFNLIEEPWIPCLFPDNKTKEVGLLEALSWSHEIQEIFHPSPLVVTALHRLLLAILHRNFGPETPKDWQVLWQRGRWDEPVLKDYFQKWHHRFYLFHPERPFYQVTEMPGARHHPIQLLALEAAAGNNPTLFDHHCSSISASFSPSQAVSYMLARQAYSIGFGKSHPFYFQDSPLIRGYAVFIIGNNLWETLALNLVPYNPEKPIPRSGPDLPVWELDSFPEPDPSGNQVSGYLSYLTWQSRRIHLIPEGDPPMVRYCQIQQNLKLPAPAPTDPFKSYRRDEKLGWVARGLIPQRTIWRDSHTLFQSADQSFHRPEVFYWASRIELLRRAGEIEAQKNYRFTITGLSTEAGKAANLVLWRQERLPLPLAYLEDQDLLDKLKEALEMAEDTNSKVLGSCLARIARLIVSPEVESPGGRTPDRNEVDRLFNSWAPARIYWSHLESPFRRLLVELPHDRETDEYDDVIYGRRCIPLWGQAVKQAARKTFSTIIAGLERNVRTLRAVAKIEGLFSHLLEQRLSKGDE